MFYVRPICFFVNFAFNVLQASIANGLHFLSQHECLTTWLADIGAVSAIVLILSATCGADELNEMNVLTDGLGTLKLLVKSSEKLKVLGKFHRFL